MTARAALRAANQRGAWFERCQPPVRGWRLGGVRGLYWYPDRAIVELFLRGALSSTGRVTRAGLEILKDRT